jgi:hypothetical protein
MYYVPGYTMLGYVKGVSWVRVQVELRICWRQLIISRVPQFLLACIHRVLFLLLGDCRAAALLKGTHMHSAECLSSYKERQLQRLCENA